RLRRTVFIVWSYVTGFGVLLLILFFVFAIVALIEKRTAEAAKVKVTEALEQTKKAEANAEQSRIEADNVRKRSDSLVGLITSVEKELTAALESSGKDSLARDLERQLS